MSFHSVIDLPNCADQFAGIDQLTTDLSTAASTPTLSYIEPHVSDLAATDAFLKDLAQELKKRGETQKPNGVRAWEEDIAVYGSLASM